MLKKLGTCKASLPIWSRKTETSMRMTYAEIKACSDQQVLSVINNHQSALERKLNMFIVGKQIYRFNFEGRPSDEKFVSVDGFSRYLVSNYGLIFDTKTQQLVSQTPYRDEKQGKKKYYYKANMIDDDGVKHYARTNRIVLMGFDSRESYDNLESHHKDEDTLNNHLPNLGWLDHKANCLDYYLGANNINIEQYLYTDDNIRSICEGLVNSLSYKEIAENILKTEYNDTIKAYIGAIRKGMIRKDISCQYNFPNKKRNTALLTDDDIHFICKCIVNGLSNNEIMIKLGVDLTNPRYKESINRIITRVRSKSRFTRISNLYF